MGYPDFLDVTARGAVACFTESATKQTFSTLQAPTGLEKYLPSKHLGNHHIVVKF